MDKEIRAARLRATLTALAFVAVIAALTWLLAGCGSEAVAEDVAEELPPAPLQSTSYRDGITRWYDTTTGHTWWVVWTRSTRQPYLVLDTAGTEAIG